MRATRIFLALALLIAPALALAAPPPAWIEIRCPASLTGVELDRIDPAAYTAPKGWSQDTTPTATSRPRCRR